MPLFEKVFVSALSLAILFVVLYAEIAARHTSSSLEGVFFFPKKMVKVVVTGAVKKPGKYSVPCGTYVREVMKKARFERYADQKRVDLARAIEDDRTIIVPKLEKLTVYLYGLSEEVLTLEVPLQTRVCHLKKLLPNEKKRDLSCLSSRRYLSDQEQFFFTKEKNETIP